MKNEFVGKMEENFSVIGERLFKELQDGEDLTLNIDGEETLFVRFNNAKVRQVTHVNQSSLSLTYIKDERKVGVSVSFTGEQEKDFEAAKELLLKAREEATKLPKDPFLTPVINNGSSHENLTGKLPNHDTVIDEMFDGLPACEINGYLTTGSVFEGNQNSKGQKHWYSTESFFVDFSIFNKDKKAVKATYAGTQWDKNAFRKKVEEANKLLHLMDKPSRKVAPGKYRVYLAPSATVELLSMYSWVCTGIGALKQGFSPMLKIESGEKKFSPLFSLTEDFSLGMSPRFNTEGELFQEKLELVKNGKHQNYLVSSRSEKEYGVKSNNAGRGEYPRSPRMAAGSLPEKDILKELGTGLYLSNLHYLNYSDRMSGRVTGMTRYACFWVENGEIVSPIEDLRFDETLFNVFGDNLRALTAFTEISPETTTYEGRHLSGMECPGMIVNDFTFNL